MGLEGAGTARARGDAVGSGDGDGGRHRDPLGRSPLSDLRPVGAGAVLDGAVELLRFRFGRLLALTACLFVPVWLLNVVLALVEPPVTTGGGGLDLLGTSAVSSSSWVWVVAVVQLCALSLLGLCVGHLAMSLTRGEDVTLGQLGSLALRRWWVAVLIVPLNGLAHAAGLCAMGIGWIVADALVFLASVVAGAERTGPWRSFARSVELTRPDLGRALVVVLGGGALTLLIRVSLSLGPTVLVTSLAPSPTLVGLVGALGSAVLLITQPLTACIAARTYLDLRCRREGYDLGLRVERLAPSSLVGPA